MNNKIGLLLLVIIINLTHCIFVAADADDITFHLYTRKASPNSTQVKTGRLNCNEFVKTLQFKFIVHGWHDNTDAPWIAKMANEYLIKYDANVVAVDWSKYSQLSYLEAMANMDKIASHITDFLVDLHKQCSASYNDMHLIGHSLGAHICGYVGHDTEKRESTKLARITGLDPAGPLFFKVVPFRRLCSKDATFVDAIHTNGLWKGFYLPIGHADFYCNGGTTPQPPCEKNQPKNICNTDIGCDHCIVHEYFTESINSYGFIAQKCQTKIQYNNKLCVNNSVALMGENCNSTTRGVYELNTNGKSPYARNGKI